MSRPVIEIRATQTDENQVFVQMSNTLHRFGNLTMPVKEYRAFLNTLMTGAAATGDEGVSIKLREEGVGIHTVTESASGPAL